MIFDLVRMHRVMDALGHPENKYPTIHIAGTNGKGSVTAMIASVLRQTGLRVGMTTSPHLEMVNERFQINGDRISDADFNFLSTLLKQNFPHLTEFEFLTALAFVWFAEKNVDVAVVETGLGGRLDATNVMSNVLASVITNIDFDHMEWLGNTIEKIAFEKAGIIKPGVPVVTGASGPALRVIDGVAERFRSPLVRASIGKNIPPLPLEGRHQRHNAAVALAALDVLDRSFVKIRPADIENGFRALRWPGRFERFMVGSGARRKTVVLDGAHNPAGCRALAAALREKKLAPVHLLFGALKDKDYAQMASALAPVAATCVTAPVQSERSSAAPALARLPAWKGKASAAASAKDALKKCSAMNGRRPIVVAGSLYLVGEIRRMIR